MPGDSTASTGTARPAVPVTRAAAVAELANGVVALAQRLDRDDLAAAIRDTADRWRDVRPRIALTGSTGAGRRTLVAALAGRPVLDRTTPQTVVEIVLAERDEVSVLAGDTAEPVPGPLPVTADGDLVRIEVAAPDAPQVTLVLPPAVDGLGTGDPRGTGGVDAVIHVMTAMRPVTDREVALLGDITTGTHQVLLAVTHTDLHHRWEGQVRASQDLLRRHVGPDVRIETIGLAPPLALSPEDDLLEDSGIPRLVELLDDTIVGRVRALRLEAVTLTCAAVLEELDLADAGDTARSTEEQLADAEEQLAATRTRGAGALTTLSDGCAMLREAVGVELQQHVRDVLDDEPDDDDLTAGLERARLAVVRWAEDRLRQLVDATADDLGELLEVHHDVGPAPTVEPDPDGTAPSTEGAGRHLRLRLGMAFAQLGTASMFAMRGLQEGTPAGLAQGGVFLLAGLLGSIASASGGRSAAQQQQDRTAAARRRRVADEWRARTQTNIRGWLLASQRELEREARNVLRTRRTTLEERIRELRRGERRASASEELADLDQRLHAVLGEESSS